jgi:hypothetical protein
MVVQYYDGHSCLNSIGITNYEIFMNKDRYYILSKASPAADGKSSVGAALNSIHPEVQDPGYPLHKSVISAIPCRALSGPVFTPPPLEPFALTLIGSRTTQCSKNICQPKHCVSVLSPDCQTDIPVRMHAQKLEALL